MGSKGFRPGREVHVQEKENMDATGKHGGGGALSSHAQLNRSKELSRATALLEQFCSSSAYVIRELAGVVRHGVTSDSGPATILSRMHGCDGAACKRPELMSAGAHRNLGNCWVSLTTH